MLSTIVFALALFTTPAAVIGIVNTAKGTTKDNRNQWIVIKLLCVILWSLFYYLPHNHTGTI